MPLPVTVAESVVSALLISRMMTHMAMMTSTRMVKSAAKTLSAVSRGGRTSSRLWRTMGKARIPVDAWERRIKIVTPGLGGIVGVDGPWVEGRLVWGLMVGGGGVRRWRGGLVLVGRGWKDGCRLRGVSEGVEYYDGNAGRGLRKFVKS